MESNNIYITKSSGKQVPFSLEKLKASLRKTTADECVIHNIITMVKQEVYQGIPTEEIYHKAYGLLKKEKGYLAARYKLKKAIYELGPTGFPFERFIGALLSYSGYTISIGEILQGNCIPHQVDVVAKKKSTIIIVECKFHKKQGFKCKVKVPLYISSRFQDIKSHWNAHLKEQKKLGQGWVVTNTRFTENAKKFGTCKDLYLLSWNYPKDNALKDRIDKLGLYPITVCTQLTAIEKQFLLSRNIILCRQLIGNSIFLDHLEVPVYRKKNILDEIAILCPSPP